MNLAYALELAAHRFPHAEAIVTGTQRLSYVEWNNLVDSVAHRLVVLGIHPGDRVAICAVNEVAPATMYFAIHRVGAIAVLLNARWKAKDIAYAIDEANVRLILFDQVSGGEVRKALELCTSELICVQAGTEAVITDIPFESLSTGSSLSHALITTTEGSTILYTSGTTGRPKGVCRSSLSDYLSALAIILEHRWERFERLLAVMPLYHTMGLHTLISLVLLNGTAVLLPKVNVAECVKYLEQEEVSALYLVPTIFHDLIEYLQNCESKVFVRKLAFAGAPMPEKLIRQCYETFQPQVFVNQYGCTEMLAITTNACLDKKPLSAGRPALHTRVRIVHADRSRCVSVTEEIPRGEAGEIIIVANSCPQAFHGYLNNAKATEQVLRDGWYFTGDLGYFDEDGDLFLAGRVDDMIITGGENVYPEEVERILLRHPGVKDAAVVGVPDQRWGECVAAFIVPALVSVTAAQLEKFCLAQADLARFKRPRKYYFVSEIPKSPTGKILRSYLKLGTESF